MKNAEQLRNCVTIYNNWISEKVEQPVREKLRVRPEELDSIFKDLKELKEIINSNKITIESLNDTQRSYLKSAILHSLETHKEDLKQRSELTTNPEVKKQLGQKVEDTTKLTEEEWFGIAVAFSTPKLEKFLTPQKEQPAQVNNATEENKSIVDLKPGIWGVSINLNPIWSKFMSWIKRR